MDYNDFEDDDLKITYKDILLHLPCIAKNLISEDIANMIKFDMIQFSLLANQTTATINMEILSRVANWKYKGIRDTCIRMSKIDDI